MDKNIQSILSKYNTEITVNQSGVVSFSIRAASRLLNVDATGLSRHFSVDINPSKLAQTLTNKGFYPVDFSNKGIPDIAMALIIEYYAFDAKKCTQEAKDLYRAFASIGIRSFFQQQLNWKSTQEDKLSEEDKLKMVESLLERKFKNKNVAAQLTLKACSIIVPEFTPLLEEAKTEIAKENAISGNELYSATDIAKILGNTTARKVNKKLEELGLQNKPKKRWIATAKAKQLDLCSELEVVASLDQKDNKWVGKQLRWKEEIFNYVKTR